MIKQYDNHSALVEELATIIAERLAKAIENDGVASIAFSGGSTPKPLFECLAYQALDWSKVQVTLVDERCVPATHERSNARLLQEFLLNSLPVTPQFFPLYIEASSLDDSLVELNQSVTNLKLPLDVAILGMGGDAHTASFFPDSANIADMMDLTNTQQLMTTISESSVEQRITWSLSSLLRTNWLALHFTGASKFEVFQEASSRHDPLSLPISGVIHQQQSPLSVFYTSE